MQNRNKIEIALKQIFQKQVIIIKIFQVEFSVQIIYILIFLLNYFFQLE